MLRTMANTPRITIQNTTGRRFLIGANELIADGSGSSAWGGVYRLIAG